MAVDGVFFWLTGVGGDGRRRAANDGGGNVQQTTEERRAVNDAGEAAETAAACGDSGGSVRWRRRSSGLGQVRMERDISFIFSFVSANCRRHEMLKP